MSCQLNTSVQSLNYWWVPFISFWFCVFCFLIYFHGWQREPSHSGSLPDSYSLQTSDKDVIVNSRTSGSPKFSSAVSRTTPQQSNVTPDSGCQLSSESLSGSTSEVLSQPSLETFTVYAGSTRTCVTDVNTLPSTAANATTVPIKITALEQEPLMLQVAVQRQFYLGFIFYAIMRSQVHKEQTYQLYDTS